MTHPLRLVFLGLSLSSSWGNGHASTYRALLKGLAGRGHDLLFLERDQPWYAAHRDLQEPGYCRLRFYDGVGALETHAPDIVGADAVILGSFVPQGCTVARWLLGRGTRALAFYDIDTPVTLAKLAAGDEDYLSAELVPAFDLYLSFSGAAALRRLREQYGAVRPRVLFCSADPALYRPTVAAPRWDLGYLGTYSPDRQPMLENLLLKPARRAPHRRFVVAGPQYPQEIDWPANVERIDHLAPADHAAFYAQARWTLNITRADMVALGHSPSVRLFEAACCGAPIISDFSEGLADLFEPRREIVIAEDAAAVLRALDMAEPARQALAAAGRRRVLAAHTAAHRAVELERYLDEVLPSRARPGAARGAIHGG